MKKIYKKTVATKITTRRMKVMIWKCNYEIDENSYPPTSLFIY